MFSLRQPFAHGRARRRCLRFAGLFASALMLAGCALDLAVQNRQPAEELAALAKPPGSVYTGWRVFQDRCAGCHGQSATGTAGGPDLLAPVRQMGPRRFVSLVLSRYDWGLSQEQAQRGRRAGSPDRRDRAAQTARAHDARLARRTPRECPYRRSVCLSVGTRRRHPGPGPPRAVARRGSRRHEGGRPPRPGAADLRALKAGSARTGRLFVVPAAPASRQ
jgi:mono/diheme cytochrome c family protein